MCFTELFLECVCVEVENLYGSYISACVYRLPKGKLNNFIAKLNEIFNYVSNRNYEGMYVFGDWNIDLMKSVN